METGLMQKNTTMINIQNYLNGELVNSLSGNWLDNCNPATGEIYSQLPDSDQNDVEKAVIAVKSAQNEWANLSNEKRGDWLLKLAQMIEDNLDTFALAETNDNGKPLWLSKNVDIPRAVSNFRFFATAIQHFASESHTMTGVGFNYTLRQPIGIVGCISPWNLPLYLFTWKIAPALAAGNCVIAKPSEITPYTAFLLSQMCVEIGFPPGVLNILHGLGSKIGSAIVSHPSISAISFTGGTSTGAQIAQTAAPIFKKLSLELGGKNPTVIFADCEYDTMLETVIRSSFTNQGEICLCGSRILIEKSLYERFKKDFVEKISQLKVGDPLELESKQGAIVSKQHFDKVLGYIELAKQEGGNILCGGFRVQLKGRCENGWFIQPTVIEGLTQNCRTNQEEIFGPVVTLMPFETEDEALSLANHSPYGLASTIWTTNLQKAHHVASQIETGIVWVNCWLIRDLRTPFGGMKASGLGREGGWEALRFFTEPKNICIKY